MKKLMLLVGIVLFAASSAMAATWTWSNNVNNADWTNSASWAEGSVPANDGTADIVITNTSAADYWSEIYEDWSIKSLTFNGSGSAQFTYVGPNPTTRTISIGSGGISGTRQTGTERWFILYPKITFTAANASVRTNSGASSFSVQFMNTIDSSVSGGSTIKIITGYNGGYMRFDEGASSTTNINWVLENTRIAIYSYNPTAALGSNVFKVAWSEGARTANRSTTIGVYGNGNNSTTTYFDTPIEFDPFAVGNSGNSGLKPLTLISQRGWGTATGVTNYYRGKWTSKGGGVVTNGSGDGWLQLSGLSDATSGYAFGKQATVWAQDSSAINVTTIGTPSWNGDFAINDSYHVVGSAHAFGTNNSFAVNLKSSSGPQTTIRARQFLLADGITYSGTVRNYSGNLVSNAPGMSAGQVALGQGWLGIHGTGTGTYSGDIHLFGQTNNINNHAQYYNLMLYAGSGSKAIFTGNFVTNTWGADGTGNKQQTNNEVFVVGGGTVQMSGHGRYLGNTTVQSNSTLVLNGTLNTSVLSVESGSKVMGTGTISNTLTVAGTIAPGNSIGQFNVRGNANLNNGSFFDVELSMSDSTSDLLNVLGTLTLGGTGTLRLIGGKANTTYTIANYGTLSGTFGTINTSQLDSGLSLQGGGISYGDGSGDSITLTVIPEPASVLLMLSGMAAAWKLRRRA